MTINIKGDPGTGNSFTEVKIENVQNYNHNVTTVINYNYGEKRKTVVSTDKDLQSAECEHLRAEIMNYVGRVKDYVAKEWKNRYETLWTHILSLPEVAADVYNPGKQKDTVFNRNLIANIIYIMCKRGVIAEDNATALTALLENDKDHAVRAKLREYPSDVEITRKVEALLES